MSKAPKPSLVALTLSIAAVAGYLAYRFTTAEPPASEAAPSAGAEARAESLPDALPEFALENLDGERQSIGSWPEQPLIVNFWATWCAPCLREIPMLKALQAENPWLTVVGIAVDKPEPVREFASEIAFNYPILVGETEGINAAAGFGVDFFAMPFTIFTDAQGRTLGVHTGELHQEHLDNVLAVLEDLRAGRADVSTARARLAGRM